MADVENNAVDAEFNVQAAEQAKTIADLFKDPELLASRDAFACATEQSFRVKILGGAADRAREIIQDWNADFQLDPKDIVLFLKTPAPTVPAVQKTPDAVFAAASSRSDERLNMYRERFVAIYDCLSGAYRTGVRALGKILA